MKRQYRQGDVFIIESSISRSAVRQKSKERIVLEEGEVTGHAHVVPANKDTQLFVKGVKKYLELCLATPLTHEEHSKISLPPGKYEVRRQCTWSALEEMSRLVAD